MTENNTINNPQPAKRKHPHKKNGYAVNNEELLYHIADAGLLCKLHGVKSNVVPRTYYFDFDPDVKSIIDKFNGNTAPT